MNDLVIGFVGLGDQGGPMARAIAEAGFDLHVWARRPASLEAAAGLAHTAHDGVASLAAVVDVLCLCLRDDGDIRDLLDGQGLTASLRPGSAVLNHGTGDPAENGRIAARLAGAGISYLDAPVSGGRPGALSRSLTTFVGGEPAVFGRCLPLLESFSRKVVHMGSVGSGQSAKLLNNALTMSNLKNAVDAFWLARRLGVDLRKLHDALMVSSGSSAILQALGGPIDAEIAPHLQGLMRKDIEHFAEAMRALDLDPSSLRDRGLAGAEGLVEIVGWLRRPEPAAADDGGAHLAARSMRPSEA
ncbi:3-hydroxyisobutyrate dehydrogenase [Tistlia consotensis]|uniref:3-hydroxyisobutyrate dehydrogenase n=1 Tax=Tistlia consotensis USBA 355 TaxID=560819 RepID=A0A1Y6CKL9_9PROT|nr:NAD(P)-dependent oxidoreductase [Tistlia consotensis]SMF73298.1 3-hydroxyisobutyrate dehydrogenase [Tistlia consotensis USBA 355]SNS30773.1 3-hydroxyisobutyrate dehydrogenase [Tistlia consotensis]